LRQKRDQGGTATVTGTKNCKKKKPFGEDLRWVLPAKKKTEHFSETSSQKRMKRRKDPSKESFGGEEEQQQKEKCWTRIVNGQPWGVKGD